MCFNLVALRILTGKKEGGGDAKLKECMNIQDRWSNTTLSVAFSAMCVPGCHR